MKKILVLAPYDSIYPALNGGMVRCYNLIEQIGKCFDTTVLAFQDGSEIPYVRERPAGHGKMQWIKVPEKPEYKDIFSLLPARFQNSIRFRWLSKTLFQQANGHFLSYYGPLKQQLETGAYDAVCMENLTLVSLAPVIKRIRPGIQLVYDAYNIDSDLAKADFDKGLITERTYKETMAVESGMYKHIDQVLTCSEQDGIGLKKLNAGMLNTVLIPNGTVVYDQLYDAAVRAEQPDTILFCGSLGYEPNREGIKWFYEAIWPIIQKQLPDLKLMIVGSGSLGDDMKALDTDPSVLFEGRVPDVKDYYNKAALSLVPLKTGSGTRLKILESMSLGVPIVSTSKGAEGVDYVAGEHMLIADDAERFAEQVITLLHNRILRLSIAQSARKLVEEKYDWNRIGARLAGVLG